MTNEHSILGKPQYSSNSTINLQEKWKEIYDDGGYALGSVTTLYKMNLSKNSIAVQSWKTLDKWGR